MAVISYKFGTKNNWRRWAWNRITERLEVPARDAVVLYLGALENLDLVEAVRRGFMIENLHHVEANLRVCDEIRRNGSLCINGDFFDVVCSWPHGRRIDVVFGDFCNGMTQSNAELISQLPVHPHVRSAVFAFNLLRGRDSSGNQFRNEWLSNRKGTPFQGKLHRAFMAYTSQAQTCMALALGGAHILDGVVTPRDEINSDQYQVLHKKYAPVVWRRTRFAQFEYRSKSHQTFDSGVWVSPFRGVDLTTWSRFDDALDASFVGCDMRRKIAAHLAHQTRRKTLAVSA